MGIYITEEHYKALDSHVLTVIVICESEKVWTVYIGEVEGRNHDYEFHDVALHGSRLDEALAKVIFPYYPKNFHYETTDLGRV